MEPKSDTASLTLTVGPATFAISPGTAAVLGINDDGSVKMSMAYNPVTDEMVVTSDKSGYTLRQYQSASRYYCMLPTHIRDARPRQGVYMFERRCEEMLVFKYLGTRSALKKQAQKTDTIQPPDFTNDNQTVEVNDIVSWIAKRSLVDPTRLVGTGIVQAIYQTANKAKIKPINNEWKLTRKSSGEQYVVYVSPDKLIVRQKHNATN